MAPSKDAVAFAACKTNAALRPPTKTVKEKKSKLIAARTVCDAISVLGAPRACI